MLGSVMRVLLPAFLIAAVLAMHGIARAGERQLAVLTYAVEPGVVCPEESIVRQLVGARLGYDPFVAAGVKASGDARAVDLRVTKRGPSLVGKVLFHEKGASEGTRELTSPSGDCEELVSSLAVTIVVGLDPLSFVSPNAGATDAKPASARADAASAHDASGPGDEASAPAPRPDDSPRARVRIHGGPILSVAAGPAVNLGVAIGAGARWRVLSIGGEGRVDLPVATTAVPGGAISASLLLGSVVPCAHVGIARGCLLASAGVLRGSGESVTAPRQTTNFYSAIGARAGVELPLNKDIAVGAHADLLGTLTRITLRLDGRDAWTTPPLSGAGGIDVVGTF